MLRMKLINNLNVLTALAAHVYEAVNWLKSYANNCSVLKKKKKART